MKKLILLLIFILAIGTVFSQIENQSIHVKSIDFSKLEQLVLGKVNELRDSLKLHSLEKDEILNKAALDQSDYIARIKKLSHNQQTWNKKTPYYRVSYYGGTHSNVGENIAFTHFNKRSKNKEGKKIIENNTLESIAESLFQGWKNSSGHYANMIHPDYFTTGINFSVNKKSKRIYATQVFGGKPYFPPLGVTNPKNAFGIEKGSDKLCNKYEAFKYGSEFFANYIVVKDGELYLYFHDLKYFKRILNGVNDAISVDIIERKQLTCGKPNVFHGSPVHDGVMLKPLYHYELYKNNLATQDNYLISHLGTIPKGMKGELQFNTTLIKKNKFCFSSYPVTVPSDQIPMFPFVPLFDITETKIEKDTIDLSFNFEIPFNRGKVNYGSRAFKTLYNRLKGYKKYITSIEVETFSSIEGSTSKNIQLQNQRLKSIISRIKNAGFSSSVLITGKSKENWDLFYKQIENTEYAYLKDKSKKEIKLFLTDKNNLYSLDKMLLKQRTAKVSVKINGIIDVNKSNDLFDISLSYHNKLQKKQMEQANSVISKALKTFDIHSGFPFDIFYSDSIKRRKNNLSVYNNQLAILMNVNWFMINKKESINIKKFIFKNKDYIPLKFNYYCHLIKYMHRTENVLLSPDILLKNIKSLREDKNWILYEKQLTEENYNRLIINYHLAALKYHRRIRKYDKIDTSLEVIKEYFNKANMTVEESTKMALFFNEYYRFDWSIEILRPYLKGNNLNEEAIFTFVQTASLLRNEFSEEDYLIYMTKAKNTNKTRFCSWINTDFQLMRYKNIKRIYCEYCK